MNCRKATYLHEKKKDGSLSLVERLNLWVHLAYCSLCRAFVHQVGRIEKSAKAAASKHDRLNPAAKENMRNNFNHRLKG